MPQVYRSQSCGSDSYTRPGSNAEPGVTGPAPKSSGVAVSPARLRGGRVVGRSAMTGVWSFSAVAAEIAAVGFAVPAMYALMAAPSVGPTWIDGTKWKSALSELAVGLYWIMPTPPACWTA